MADVSYSFCEAMKVQNISLNVNHCYAFISFLYSCVDFGCKNKLCFQWSPTGMIITGFNASYESLKQYLRRKPEMKIVV